MRAVNLLPPEDRKARGLNLSKDRLLMIGGAVVVAALGFWGYSISSSQGAIQEQITQADAQASAAQQETATFVAANSRATKAQANEADVRKLIATRTNWEKLIRQVSAVLPRQITVTTLTAGFSGPAVGGVAQKGLHIDGTAASRAQVLLAGRRLQSVPGLGEPILTGALDADKKGGRGVVNFSYDVPVDLRAQDRAKLQQTTNTGGTSAPTQVQAP